MQDSAFLMELRNDPAVIRASRVDEPVQQAEHLAWLRSSLERSDRRLFVVCAGDLRVGQARLDRTAVGEVVSIVLDRTRRGLGYGRATLTALQAEARGDLLAEVRRDNAASLALFVSVGFEVVTESSEGFVQLRWTPLMNDGATGR